MDSLHMVSWLNTILDRCRVLIQERTAITQWEDTREDGCHIITNVDIAIEELLRESIRIAYPAAGIFAEETSRDSSVLQQEICFVIDPIDGTREFVQGHSGFSIAVAILEHGHPTVGLVDFPARGQRFQAIRNQGATMNGSPLRVSAVTDIPGARIAVSPAQSQTPSFSLVEKSLKETTLIPMSATSLRLTSVASGEIDAAFQLPLNGTVIALWDYAAAALILEEAGGCFTGFYGEKLSTDLPPFHRQGWIATNGVCHLEVKELVH